MRVLAIALLALVVGCGAAGTDFIGPAYRTTIEACRQRQVRALERADDRATAEVAVADVRRRCDIAYAGFEAAAALVEEEVSQ